MQVQVVRFRENRKKKKLRKVNGVGWLQDEALPDTQRLVDSVSITSYAENCLISSDLRSVTTENERSYQIYAYEGNVSNLGSGHLLLSWEKNDFDSGNRHLPFSVQTKRWTPMPTCASIRYGGRSRPDIVSSRICSGWTNIRSDRSM